MSSLPYSVTLEELGELLLRFPFERPIKSISLRGCSESQRPTDSDSQVIVHAGGITLNRGTWTWRCGDRSWARGQPEEPSFIVEALCSSEGRFSSSLRDLVLKVVARIQLRFNLPVEAVAVFPQSTHDKEDVPPSRLGLDLNELPHKLEQLKEDVSMTSAETDFPFPLTARSVWTLIDEVRSQPPEDSAVFSQTNPSEFPFPPGRGVPLSSSHDRDHLDVPRAIELTASVKQDLRAHVINLAQGRFSQEGWKTQSGDVDTIFRKHIRDWASTRPVDEKLRIMIYAHGGLTDEAAGLEMAANRMQWWKDNGVYPIFFVWETGLLETLGQLINPDRQREIDLAAPTDFLLEHVARGLGGGIIWSGMKRSAERASGVEGGALYTVTELCKLLQSELGPRLELHAVGHSAGAIFHSHFITAALQAGVPAFESLTLLAPAITVDEFKKTLLPHIQGQVKKIKRTAMFTMARPFELDDNCIQIYRKSLLCLIRAALEPEPRTPILGLEESIRGDTDLMKLFDPDGSAASRSEEIIFSQTKAVSGRSASQSTSHGGFDDDPATMESVARRILNRDNIKPFPRPRGINASRESPSPREAALLANLLRGPKLNRSNNGHSKPLVVDSPVPRAGSSGSKQALCVGIDRYPDKPLGGCVNDARQWESALRSLGFSTETLLDEAATRDAILQRLTSLISESHAGDNIVFQYAGHGTQLPDLDADEDDSFDEALCPIDYAAGRFLIDDDLAVVFDRIPDGVNVTVFTDCCHSGTITRFAVGTPSAGSTDSTQRMRFLVATPELEAAHRRDRERLGRSRGSRAKRSYEDAKEVLFCACRAIELARESNGHGLFTNRVVPLLTQAGAGITHEQFEQTIIKAFDNITDQHPELHCAQSRRTAALLGFATGNRPALSSFTATTPTDERETIRRAFEFVAESLR